MDTLLVKPSNEEELNLLQQLLRKMNIETEVISKDEFEDNALLEAMDQERTNTFVDEKEVLKALS